jgi:DNA-binding PadR family transcriptional regulator
LTETFKKELVQHMIRSLLHVYILRLIQTQPKWGYRIKKDVETKFGVKLRHGTLYPLLNTLERDGFVTSQEQQQGRRTRKVYAITEKGNEYLETYRSMLKEQLSDADIR